MMIKFSKILAEYASISPRIAVQESEFGYQQRPPPSGPPLLSLRETLFISPPTPPIIFFFFQVS
jgi:hypothetical protein